MINRELNTLIFWSNRSHPFALRYQKDQLSRWLLGGLIITLGFLLSTLLYFVEVEENRRLHDRVLELETLQKLSQLRDTLPPEPKVDPKIVPIPVPQVTPRPVQIARRVDSPPAIRNQPLLSEFNVECTETACEAAIGLLPKQPGSVDGGLLLILETQIRGIGMGSGETPWRRYLTYPEGNSLNEMNDDLIVTLTRKQFHFVRSLTTKAPFDLGKQLLPTAINLYLFDAEGSILLHERKTLERSEPQ